MALKFMTGNTARLLKKPKDLSQKFKYLLILDFEATCEKEIAINKQEIIEFPCLAVNTNNWKIENSFHSYIKPKINPILSTFCTDLTGIMQETVDDEEHFPIVFDKFRNWLNDNNYLINDDDNKSAFVTCGDWDLKVMLPTQCQYDNLQIPNYLKQWINLKISFYETKKHFPKSLRDMLMRLRLERQGHLHSGLYDAMNMAKVIQELGKNYNTIFDITTRNQD